MADREHIMQELEESEALTADGFEDALIGIVERPGMTVALYDRDQCIDILMSRDGMSHEEAEEYFDFNVRSAWFGDKTPAFATLLTKEV